jgi:hypothetical protein
MKSISTFLVLLLSLPAIAFAQDKNDWQSWPLADRFTIAFDAFFPNLDTKVRIDASDRTNGYRANLEVSEIDGVWKLTGLEILEEQRL